MLKPKVELLLFVLLLVLSAAAEFRIKGVEARSPSDGGILQLHAPILINGNTGFTVANGITGGSGTLSDPYRIESWEIDGSIGSKVCPTDPVGTAGIIVCDTTLYFIVRNVVVDSGDYGILFSNATNGAVEHVSVSHNSWGLAVRSSRNISLVADNVTNNTNPGQVSGVVIIGSDDVTASAINFTDGLYARDSSNVSVDNSWIGFSGLLFVNCSSCSVIGNVGRSIGIFSGSVKISNNHVGIIWIDVGSNMTIEGNAIDGGAPCVALCGGQGLEGIHLGDETWLKNIAIFDNTISNNYYGVRFDSQSTSNVTFYHNNFVNNVVDVSVRGDSGTFWDDGYPNGGNYWSDYNGTDNCSGMAQTICSEPDGMGDTPKTVASSFGSELFDHYPLMRPFASITGNVTFTPATVPVSRVNGLITARVQLPRGLNGSNILQSSIRLNGQLMPTQSRLIVHRTEGSPERVLIASFAIQGIRTSVDNPAVYPLTVTFNVLTDVKFYRLTATGNVRFQ